MRRRLISLLLFALAVAMAYAVLRSHLTIERLAEEEDRLRRIVDFYPLSSLVLGWGIYTLASLVPGTTGKSMVYGWLFGFWPGLLLVNFGLTAAALIAFLAIRFGFKDAAHARLGTTLGRLDEALLRRGASYLLILRLLHAPFSLTNYAAGITAVPTRTFWWTTHVGLLPGNIAFVLAGSQIPSFLDLLT